jgi:hypothetical protein
MLFVFASSTAGCDGTMTATGVVRDYAGKKIVNARVTLQNDEELTDSRGCFDVFVVVAPRRHLRRLRVQADGYQPDLTSFLTALPDDAMARVDRALVFALGVGESGVESRA